MHAFLTAADDVLRQAPWVTRQLDSRRAILRLVAFLVLFGLLYGAAMGTLPRLGRPAAMGPADCFTLPSKCRYC